jgi:hypothetical protein
MISMARHVTIRSNPDLALELAISEHFGGKKTGKPITLQIGRATFQAQLISVSQSLNSIAIEFVIFDEPEPKAPQKRKKK